MNSKPIVIMPFSVPALFVYHVLKRNGRKVACFVDNDSRKQGFVYDGTSVLAPEEAGSLYNRLDCTICNLGYKSVMKAQLQEAGFQSFVDFEDFVELSNGFEEKEDFIQTEELALFGAQFVRHLGLVEYLIRFNSLPKRITEKTNPITSPVLGLSITNHCTLNCRDCLVKIPYYKTPGHITFDDFKLSIDNLAEAFDYISSLHLIGGETFLYPELPRLLKYVRDKHSEKFGFLDVFTNSLHLPSQEQIDAIIETECGIIISDYGDLSKSIDELIRLCEVYGIRYTIQNRREWVKIEMDYTQNSDPETTQNRFDRCSQTVCYMVADGSLYPCSPLAFHTKLGIIPKNSDNYVDCTKPIDTDVLRSFLSRNRYFDACKYCSGGDYEGNTVPSTIQAKGKIPYKRYDEVEVIGV